MSKPIIIANWKMNLGPKESAALALAIKEKIKNKPDGEIVLCPSFSALSGVKEKISRSRLKLGAQDVFWQVAGSFTGEESSRSLLELGCEYAIIGHSERRQYLGESEIMINKKIAAALAHSLTPVVCVGETLLERQEGRAGYRILSQLEAALQGIEVVAGEELVVAYEPIWSIGTGLPVSAEQAEEIFGLIRQVLLDLYPLTIVNNHVRLIYGGSVNAANASDFKAVGLINGFLVGGASLKANEFSSLVNNFFKD